MPLVLHWKGSGITDEEFKQAISAGISIIHINTELSVAYKQALQKFLLKIQTKSLLINISVPPAMLCRLWWKKGGAVCWKVTFEMLLLAQRSFSEVRPQRVTLKFLNLIPPALRTSPHPTLRHCPP